MVKQYDKIIDIKTVNDKYYYSYLNKNDSISEKELKIGTRLKYNNAFGITREMLSLIHYSLVKYHPSHHGLYIGNGKVLQFAGQTGGGGGDGLYEMFKGKFNAKVITVDINKFKENSKKKKSSLYAYYNINDESTDIILERANSILGNKNYNVINNNCEHAVNYCVYGKGKSEQVNTILYDLLRKCIIIPILKRINL
jgi:hypothetical protein